MKRWMLLVWAGVGAVSISAAELKIGFARTDITPPLGVSMPGYYQMRHAKAILDPLQINCLAFSDGAKTAFLMQVDTMCLSSWVAERMRDAIIAATGADRDSIMLHASHTHDGGNLSMNLKRGNVVVGEKADPLTELYVRMTASRAADAAVLAVRDLKVAKLSYNRSFARRISFGRRYKMKDGKVRTNPGTNNPDIVGPAGNPPDESVQVLRIDRTGGKPICLINFQTHPDVVGGETITADWPGLARTVFEGATLGKTHCLVINGTQGDVNHCNVMPKPGELNGLTRDFDAVDRGYDHAWHMANVVAAAALSVWMKCIPLATGPVNTATRTVRVPSQRPTAKELEWAKDVWAKHEAGKDAELPWKDMELTTEVARAGRMMRLADGPDYFDLPIIGISIGKSVAFGGFPGEPFNEIGTAVKKNSPFTLTIPACLVNGSRGYFPFSDAYTQGGYESATSPFGPTVADDLIKGQGQLLEDLYRNGQ